ncbi:hypothetical protein K6119_15430 [Paracrocinitomix mangrovi]|uniref:hypothetical protein n=1 Tax=Paracrocinitomix mangrovi TaxID=2862509 RepID=UPI001C8E8FB2|nr:hypothetical protein [Paracrocinitomix mangrovi]UKN01120.1 hypothetical protein K6119_15430 [Paracrocinitomix mangrovi]
MKQFFLILVSTVMLFSCDEKDLEKVEYSTSTMMGRTVLSVSKDSVVVNFNGRGNPTHFSRATKDGEWDGVLSSLSKVEFDQVGDLTAPSNKRATDAAAHASFIFITKDSTIRSASFDDNNPHEMLIPLMKEINKIQEENKK